MISRAAVEPGSVSPLRGVDGHMHVFDGRPPHADAAYTPPLATVEDAFERARQLGAGNLVVVTASAQGTDNSLLESTLQAHPDRTRGVAVVNLKQPGAEEEIARLVSNGVVGFRVQGIFPGGVDLSHLPAMQAALDGTGAHVEVWADVVPNREALLRAAERGPLVIDHLGFHKLDPRGPSQTREDHSIPVLKDLMSAGAFVTVSGSGRNVEGLPEHLAAARLRSRVDALVETDATHLLWGSDGPHVRQPGGLVPTVDQLRAARNTLLPSDELQKQVIENTRDRYHFD